MLPASTYGPAIGWPSLPSRAVSLTARPRRNGHCHITQNWRGKPLESRAAVIELIGATTTKTGLKIECALDERIYEKGIRIKKAAMKLLDIAGDEFHPESNYTIKPRGFDKP